MKGPDGHRPQSRVTFTPLPGARITSAEETPKHRPNVDSPQFKANTSFLPPIKALAKQMNPSIREKAVQTELDFLSELYRTAGGDKWLRRRRWCEEKAAFDTWEGVVGVDSGTPSDRRVYQRCVGELWLGNCGLDGSLPATFLWQGVPHLALIELQHNPQLGGPLPQLASLKRLVVLDVRGCRLEGELPQDMPPNLQRLLLSENKFNGQLHRWNLPKLRFLNLSHNKLTGCRESGVFADMTDLEMLDAQDNLIRHEWSDLWGGAAAGGATTQPSPYRLPLNLTSLNMSRNRLRGEVGTSTFGGCVSLRYLNLSENQLGGQLGERLGNLSGLRDLRVGNNSFTGKLPQDLTRLQKLRTLSLRGNDLEGPLDSIRWAALAANLRHLDLGHNPKMGGKLEAEPSALKQKVDPNSGELLALVAAPVKAWRYRGKPGEEWSEDEGSDDDDDDEEEGDDDEDDGSDEEGGGRKGDGDDDDNDDDEDGDEGGGDNSNQSRGRPNRSRHSNKARGGGGGQLSMEATKAAEAKALERALELLDDDSKTVLKLRRVGGLKRLRHLDLSSCGLVGPVPKSLYKLTKLEILYLDDNAFSGRLPRLRKPSTRRRRTLSSGDGGGVGTGPGQEDGLEVQGGEEGDPARSLWGFGEDDGLEGGLRGLKALRELGLARNKLEGSLTAAVRALPRGVSVVRLSNNLFVERRPKMGPSDLSATLSPAILRLVSPNPPPVDFTSKANTNVNGATTTTTNAAAFPAAFPPTLPLPGGDGGGRSSSRSSSRSKHARTLLSIMLEGNDLGRCPAGRGERGPGSEDESDGDSDEEEEGVLEGPVRDALKRQKLRQRKAAREIVNEDALGRPLGLSLVECERALSRQRHAVFHTLKAVQKALRGRDVVVLMDPPLTDKLQFRPKEAAEHSERMPSGLLGTLRYDLNLVLAGKANDLPDYGGSGNDTHEGKSKHDKGGKSNDKNKSKKQLLGNGDGGQEGAGGRLLPQSGGGRAAGGGRKNKKRVEAPPPSLDKTIAAATLGRGDGLLADSYGDGDGDDGSGGGGGEGLGGGGSALVIGTSGSSLLEREGGDRESSGGRTGQEVAAETLAATKTLSTGATASEPEGQQIPSNFNYRSHRAGWDI